jgi:hypothetical protein
LPESEQGLPPLLGVETVKLLFQWFNHGGEHVSGERTGINPKAA